MLWVENHEVGVSIRILTNCDCVQETESIFYQPLQSLSSTIRASISRRSRLPTLVANNCGTLKNPHTIRKE